MNLFANKLLTLFLLTTSASASLVDWTEKSEINLEQHPGELCSRACVKGDSKICYFKFNIEFFQAMGVACNNCINGIGADCDNAQCIVGDGTQKGVMSINRQIPGPAIQACIGDYIVVDVTNLAPGTTTTIHWHGLNMRNAKFMDGVPFITQCPIAFGTSFRYQFEIVEVGTYFYHAHSGLHKANGIYGALILRQPETDDQLAGSYDYDLAEHYLLISDWLHNYVEFLYPGLPSRQNKPDAVLLNGRGTYINNTTRIREASPPPHIMYVEAGKRYRFRAIGAHAFNCLMYLQIESHMLNVIATDGIDVESMSFDGICLNAGERYDFVLDANQIPGDYWIRLRGLGVCEYYSLTEAFILLRYKTDTILEKPLPTFPDYDEIYAHNKVLNYPNQTCDNMKQNSCVTKLQAIRDELELRNAKPDYRFYLGFNNHKLKQSHVFNKKNYNHFRNLEDNILEVSGIDNITFIEPHIPLLSQPDDFDESIFCDHAHKPSICNNDEYCPCTHRLKVALNSIVEIILVDENSEPLPIHHPMHLHGYHFLVTNIGQRPTDVPNQRHILKAMYANDTLQRNAFNRNTLKKDTISVPTNGYAIVRFRADNAGYWFLHCHYDFHMIMGMSLVLQVGEKSDLPETPENFPKCGNYLPKVLR